MASSPLPFPFPPNTTSYRAGAIFKFEMCQSAPSHPVYAGREAKGSNPTAGLTLLWARNPFRGNFNHWQVSRKEAGQIFFKRKHGCGKDITI